MPRLSFLDTNIFIYAQDGRDKRKQKVAATLIRKLIEQRSGVISTQVIQEFCNAGRKPDINLATPIVMETIRFVLRPLLAQRPSIEFYIDTLELSSRNSLSFYDALIIQAALDMGCDTLYSEDLQHGQKFGKLTIVNPFI